MITGRPFVWYWTALPAMTVYVEDEIEAFMRAGSVPVETARIYNIGADGTPPSRKYTA
jgi:nucleoside-diphosphate-sugar epimerase